VGEAACTHCRADCDASGSRPVSQSVSHIAGCADARVRGITAPAWALSCGHRRGKPSTTRGRAGERRPRCDLESCLCRPPCTLAAWRSTDCMRRCSGTDQRPGPSLQARWGFSVSMNGCVAWRIGEWDSLRPGPLQEHRRVDGDSGPPIACGAAAAAAAFWRQTVTDPSLFTSTPQAAEPGAPGSIYVVFERRDRHTLVFGSDRDARRWAGGIGPEDALWASGGGMRRRRRRNHARKYEQCETSGSIFSTSQCEAVCVRMHISGYFFFLLCRHGSTTTRLAADGGEGVCVCC
jgi:hypothetical protein